MPNIRTYLSCTQGVAAIEAALILPMLLLAGFGTLDASYLILQHHKMETNLATAGSYLSKSSDPQSLELQAKRLAATGQIRAGGRPTITNWSHDDISISYKNFTNHQFRGRRLYRGGAVVKVVNISSSVPYQGLGLLNALSGGTITLSGAYEERLVSAL